MSHLEAKAEDVLSVQDLDEKTDVDLNTFVRVPLARNEFILVYVGLLLAILMAALDQTIVATALKAIVNDFGHQDLVPWIGSAYLLTAAPIGTLYGKFADIFGRKWVFIFALVVFEFGSFLCGISTNMMFLIIGRAIAGIGGGGIFSLVLIIISDIVSLQDRGKFQGLIGATFGLASVIGPLVGGAFSDHISWRWCFYINLPLGFITVLSAILFLKFPRVEGSMADKIHRIDFLGTSIFALAIISGALPLQLGGTTWPWYSGPVVGLFSASVVLFALFCVVETKYAIDPLIPPTIFVNRNVPLLLLVAMMLGASFYSGVYYISLFFQIVNGASATAAGIQTIPLVFGVVSLSVLSGLYLSKTGKYRHFFFIGPVFMITGTVLISYLDRNSLLVQKIFYLFIFGIGAGNLIQMRVLALQASVDYSKIAIVTAVSTTAQTLGGAVGVAITGTILNNILSSKIAQEEILSNTTSAINREIPLDTTNVLQMYEVLTFLLDEPPEFRSLTAKIGLESINNALTELIDAFTASFSVTYLSLLPYGCVILILAFFIKQYGFKVSSREISSVAH